MAKSLEVYNKYMTLLTILGVIILCLACGRNGDSNGDDGGGRPPTDTTDPGSIAVF